MISEMSIVFKKIGPNQWSSGEYEVLTKFGDSTTTHEGDFVSLSEATSLVKKAKSDLSKFEALIGFITDKKPERWQIVFYLEENKIHHSNSALNCLIIYF